MERLRQMWVPNQYAPVKVFSLSYFWWLLGRSSTLLERNVVWGRLRGCSQTCVILDSSAEGSLWGRFLRHLWHHVACCSSWYDGSPLYHCARWLQSLHPKAASLSLPQFYPQLHSSDASLLKWFLGRPTSAPRRAFTIWPSLCALGTCFYARLLFWDGLYWRYACQQAKSSWQSARHGLHRPVGSSLYFRFAPSLSRHENAHWFPHGELARSQPLSLVFPLPQLSFFCLGWVYLASVEATPASF